MSTYAEEAGKAAQQAKNEVEDKVNEAKNSQAAEDAKKDAEDLENKLKDGAERIKNAADSKIEGVKKDFPTFKEEALKKEREIADELKKDYDQTKSWLSQVFNCISEKISEKSACFYTKASNFTAVASEELKNPVVLSQTVVAIAAIPALVVAIQERSKIFGGKTDTEITLILSALIGFVALDGFVFSSLYPKYDKKSKKL